MTPAQYQAYLASQQSPETQRKQGAVKSASGLFDFFRGKSMASDADAQIEEVGANMDDLQSQMDNLKAPGMMDPNVVAAATRNAAILGTSASAPDPSAELAAAKMAIESGMDPSAIQRNLQGSINAEQVAAQNQARSDFQQGLGFAQQDAFNQFQQEQGALQNQYDAAMNELNYLQNQSAMGQDLSNKGTASTIQGLTQFASNFDKDAGGEDAGFLKTLGANLFGNPTPSGNTNPTNTDPTKTAEELGLTNVGNTNSQERGGIVQKTPGEFDHDTNDMILMAQSEGGLVDTGIRQTGGEFVLNPEQAEGLEEAYDNVDPRDPTYDQLLALYEAARFLDEPQFDDDYAA